MSFSTATLKAEVKETSGTGVARAVRREGKVPVVVYNKGKSRMLAVNARELTLEYLKGRFFSRIVELDTGKEKINVLPQEIQMDPVKDTPLHADFISVDAKTRVKVAVPVSFINQDKSPGLKRGGILNAVRRTVDIYCNASAIPEKLIADVGGLQIGGNIRWNSLQKPEGIESVIKGRDFTIATIAGRMAEEEVAAAAAATTAVAGAAAPAAGAAAPAAGAAAPAAGAVASAKPAGKK